MGSELGDSDPQRFAAEEGTLTRAVTPSPAVEVAGETRWPMAGAVVAAAVLTVLLPDDVRVAPNWVLPVVEGFLLVLLITGDPGDGIQPD